MNGIGRYGKCGNSVVTAHEIDRKMGFCHYFKVSCTDKSCAWYKTVYTSKDAKMGSRGRNGFDINLRSIIIFREIGRGHSSLETFAGFMNMPPPMNQTAYNDRVKQIHIAYTKQARSSIQMAATEIRKLHLHEEFRDDAVADIFADGLW